MKYALVNYFDVWGNEKDGWEINNQCVEFDDLHISEDATEKNILDFLVMLGFLSTSDRRKIRIDMNTYAEAMEIYAVKGNRPIASLRRVA